MSKFNEIAKKWQSRWEENKIFKTEKDSKKEKFYCLEMFPYPSGYLHMGHVRNYSIGDAFARYKRMQGLNVLYPMGYDSFGLPAENAAIQKKVDPGRWTEENIEGIKKQQKAMGLSYDWDREIATCRPEYYRWNQWIFLKLLEKGMVYKKKSFVNWCPKCNTVLANEQVHDGKCWRHGNTDVIQKDLEQWFFKITEYAQELLDDLDKLPGWPDRVKTMQRNWIGRSEGVKLRFEVLDEKGSKVDEIETFTTRVDTVYGITYLVLAPEHPKVIEWIRDTEYEKPVKEFISKIKKESLAERTAEEKEKKGMFIGKYFLNPFTGEKCPLWVADYALYEYGTGAVMAVPTHDQRDFEFAQKYNLPKKVVINSPMYDLSPDKMSRAYVDDGVMVNSGEFDGMNNMDAIKDIADLAEKKGWGKRTVTYKLRDWLISRQRYWGTPIPIIYCDKCGVVPVPEERLPVNLPKDAEFTGEGNPLETSEEFINCKCPKCSGKGRRETDTMDTFVDSSWYFLRYCSPDDENLPFNPEKAGYFMPVDQYIGGIEHACMHLIYARFFTKALRDLDLLKFDEPFTKLLTQGMVVKDGAKMSKSLGNVVDPAEIIEKYGPDTARLFILFAALPEKELEWSDRGVKGAYKFLTRVYNLTEMPDSTGELENKDRKIISKLNKTIKRVTELIEEFKLSLAIGTIMELVNEIYKYKEEKVNREVYMESVSKIALLVSPFAPHVAEEVWEKLGKKGFISLESWPEFDESKIDEEAEISEKNIDETIRDIKRVLELINKEKPDMIKLIISPVWKYKLFSLLKEEMDNTRDVKSLISITMGEKDLREYGKEISKIIPKVVKDPSKMPEIVLNQEKELENIKNSQSKIEEEFGAKIEFETAEKSSDPKAKNAIPGKPAILIE